MNPTQVFTQVIVRVLKKPPGFRDTNLHILALRLDLVRMLAENYPFSRYAQNFFQSQKSALPIQIKVQFLSMSLYIVSQMHEIIEEIHFLVFHLTIA